MHKQYYKTNDKNYFTSIKVDQEGNKIMIKYHTKENTVYRSAY